MSALLLAAACACALVMGAAIQRGATCAVAAVSEVIEQRRASRLASLLEASAWVAVGLALIQHLPLQLPALPSAYALNRWTFVGAVLLGLGAWVNRACVFGAIARLGSGDWAYAATPLGFYLGCVATGSLNAASMARPLPAGPSSFVHSIALAALFMSVIVWRAVRCWRYRGTERAIGWTPHVATVSIAIAFLALLLLEGPWAYTDTLASAARGMSMATTKNLVLFACLLLGAIGGGWRAGLLRSRGPRPSAVLRCLAGGFLMGSGSLLIPGSNDGLILFGLPMLWPHAWAAFLTMGGVIALAMVVSQPHRAGGSTKRNCSRPARTVGS